MPRQPDLAADSAVGDQRATHAPWLALIVIVLAQLQMAINVSVLPVSLGPISEDLNAPATATATALLLYAMFVAAFVMLGAKIGKLLGERRVFQVGVVAHGLTMALMATSTDAATMNIAQAIAGVAAAGLVPTLVVLIAANYHGRQQETALGVLAGIPAVASALTFVVAGILATTLSWLLVLADRPAGGRRPRLELSPHAHPSTTRHQGRLRRGGALSCRYRAHPVGVQQPRDVGAARGQGRGAVLPAALVAGADDHPLRDRARPSLLRVVQAARGCQEAAAARAGGVGQ
jgi:hypothetical protein